MGLLGLLTWPIRSTVALITQLLRLFISIVLFPYKITSTLVRSLFDKANNAALFVEEKIRVVKTRKPISYFFPCQVVTPATDKDPAAAITTQSEIDSDVDGESQSIASLIQDLIQLSQPETRQQYPDSSRQTQQEKIQLLLQELQELAETGGVGSSGEGKEGEREQDEEGVSAMLKDLGVLEGYLNQFLEEQEHQPNVLLLPDRTSSLETIMEETTSKESSPYHPGSPLPPAHRIRPLAPSEGTIDEEERGLSDSQNEISQTLLMLQKVTNSQELKETLQQLAEMHKQNEFETPPSSLSSTPDPGSSRQSPPSDKERHEALTNELTDSQQQMDSIVNSLVQQQKVMTCQQELLSSQQELQDVMDSLTLQTVSDTPPKPLSATPPKPLSATPTQDQLYDSLANINAATPTYAKVDKKPRPPNTAPTTPKEDIYDSIQPISTNQSGTDDIPPPIPRRRTGSDASTDSCDNSSPVLHHKKKRHHSNEEECSCGHRHRRHRRHSSHHRRHSDHSPDDRHHRSHDRCRHRHCRHSTSDDSQDESDYPGSGRRGQYESSGYDSHQDMDSPVVTRRRGRAKSDVNLGVDPVMTPPTPGRRSFFGFFGKSKSTSLTSLSSSKSGVF